MSRVNTVVTCQWATRHSVYRPYMLCGVRLSNSRTVERILFIFDVQEFMHHRSVLGVSKHSSSKNMGRSYGTPNHKITNFSKTALNDFD